jgi:hypothetical protein
MLFYYADVIQKKEKLALMMVSKYDYTSIGISSFEAVLMVVLSLK